jgi:hypothetical protein
MIGAIELQEQEEENRIYLTDDGLTSNYTKNTYHNVFEHFIKITVKNKDLRVLLDTSMSCSGISVVGQNKILQQ